jgi:hypothetical protein
VPLAPEYVVPPLTNSPSALVDDFLAYLEANLPGWQGSPGNLDVLIGEAFSFPATDTADLASGVLTSVFRYFGGLVGVPVIDGTPASASADFTMVDDAGYTIDEGSTVGLRDDNGDLWGFTLPDDLVIAPGDTTGSVTVYAERVGIAANGLSGVAELVAVPGSVASVNFASATDGGADAEADGDYLNRLRETLTLLTPEPILPDDFAVLARTIPGVARATAVDGLKPGPPYTGTAESTGNERMVAVAVAGATGLSVGSTILAAVQTYLDGLREQSFVPYAVDPQYATIDVATTVKVWPNFDPADVQAGVEQTLADLLSPATWGNGDRGTSAAWLNDPVVRQSRLYQAISNTAGVRYVTALAFGLHGGSQGVIDVTMGSGSAIPALPLAGTIAVTATP